MDCTHFIEFARYVDDQILPATVDLENLADANRKHVQRLVFTNMVDRFDTTVDHSFLSNCRAAPLLESALSKLDKTVAEGQLYRLLLGGNWDAVIDEQIQSAIRNSELRARHSRKLFSFLKACGFADKESMSPRVNPSTGVITKSFTQQNIAIPASIAGYADWLYSRRNAVVHGGKSNQLLSNDISQMEEQYKVKPAKTFKLSISSIRVAAKFYTQLAELVKKQCEAHP